MDTILDFIKSENFLFIIAIISIILLIGFITVIISLNKLNKKYKKFLEKLGNGKNLEEDLENFMYKTSRVEKQNIEIIENIKNLSSDMTKCIQKIGIVRYSAFKDTGSDLSFALALLDENNNGVVLNGIYSREMSNIYAKPVENGKSTYAISEEENKAIQKAITSNERYQV